ncbi:probable phosphoglycerate mutase [Corynebacterium mycetoides]|uniref:phosphoglycerate mutase (2,3-diphosphoglycerate-dependent) n=1 Tax=Corynebacterium mycetoides TaxID=38302 RepID=A0A1G9NFM5_9CORY|nr:bifunctional RNase H/acid phosphatase [Corynebacterium mycetoides]SDL84725.1 probable phosphoglycerate mutase [Corynebacterium mycetoides]
MLVKVFTDGGSRGNPGVAGSGSVVYGESGETLAEIAYVVGRKSSNNVAEYHGLLRGLEAARDLGATRVEVYMDSKLVVEQMSGRWKIKHPDMQELALAARALAAGFESVSYTWVPRAHNKKADELSNVAMDAAAKGAAPGIVGAGQHEVASPAHWHGADAPRTRFVLLRHGQTEHSAAKLYSGSSDPSLTDVGVEQAQRAAHAVAAMEPIDVIVTSPQTRARQTAKACADALGIADIDVDEGLREMDYGAFEGLSRAECVERYAEEFDAWQASTSVAPPDGESLAALHRRVTRARLALQDKHEGKTILVVTHMTPIKSIIRQGLGVGDEAFRHIFLDLASVSVVEFYGDFGVVRCVNDVAHHR